MSNKKTKTPKAKAAMTTLRQCYLKPESAFLKGGSTKQYQYQSVQAIH